MAESKRVKAEEADEKDLTANLSEEATPIDPAANVVVISEDVPVAEKADDEEVSAEEPLEIFSTADESMFLTESGEFNWDAYEAAGGYNSDDRKKYDKIYEDTLSVIREREVVDGTVVSINKKRSCSKHRLQV